MRFALCLALIAATADAADVPLHVRETAGIARAGEILRSGIPLPRSANVRSVERLAIVDERGAAVPAEFRVLARWNAGRSSNEPIQWLLVAFPASVAANATATYRLVFDGSNPAPATPLRVERNGNRVSVDTGVATFVIDGSALFDEIRYNGARIAGGGATPGFTTLRRVTVEQGPLTAIVIVDGGEADFGAQRRYLFTAGSATAIVRQTLAWENRVCDGAGVIVCGSTPNATRLQRVRVTSNLALTAPLDITLAGARNASAVHASATTAFVRQKLRATRTAPSQYELSIGNTTVAGPEADGALLAISGSEGTLAIALDHMHRYEPQALRLLENGALAIDIADDSTWLGARQGLFATFAVTAASRNATRAELERTTWAPLNRPLRAWPDGAWFTASGAVDPVPPLALPSAFADYDAAMRQVLERTKQKTDTLGVHGLMTFGLFPRLWGNPIFSDEIDCFGNDPTPQEHWDDLYWCSMWTDYHNTASTAAAHAMRTGEVEWLDEIARPAALRQLYTQILRCAPGDDYFYCGQSPAGYGGYRADFNSSHAYFDNLILHYWLTGDTEVVDTLERGATSMRNYLCTRRPGAPCQPHDAPIDEFANLTGRVASQWAVAFRFVGMATDDATFLDDWRANLARALTQQYVKADGYGFLFGGWQPVGASGSRSTDQLWMTALYDMKTLDLLRRDTGDAPIGDPAIRPSDAITSFARTLTRLGPLSGDWPNQLDVTWSGNTLISMRPSPGGGDPLLYDTGKSTLAGPAAAAAAFTGDPALRALATQLATFAIRASLADGSPLGKLQGEYLARLHAAIAMLAPPAPPQRRRTTRH